jgi:hypothetical protein
MEIYWFHIESANLELASNSGDGLLLNIVAESKTATIGIGQGKNALISD